MNQQLQLSPNSRTRDVGNERFSASFISFSAEAADSRHVFSIGKIANIARWTAARRNEPFWMLPAVGEKIGAVPIETQFLLAQTSEEKYLLFVPLIDDRFRSSLNGDEADDSLQIVVEAGDFSVTARDFTSLFVAGGDDPFALIEYSSRQVMQHLGSGRLRADKPNASFTHDFGWCTWDAFYHDVSHEKVREGLESFRRGGVQPRLLILDDGWQSIEGKADGARQLTSFAPNEKFGGDLRPTVEMAKSEFGVETFLVWHAFNGYWGGVDGEKLSGYGARNIERRSSPGIVGYNPTFDTWWGRTLGVVAPEHIYRFYHDYHRTLRAQGVDGVKVDVQAAVEAVAQGFGGRVALMRAYREALEGSVAVHFEGDLINCMSCSNEMIYQANSSTLTRTSTDFWPNIAASHGLHLWTNAVVSLWFGQFIQPDWDMFQSAHEMGAYHAAARAVAGCPVYVSDKVGAHDFDLLRKLVLPDGKTLQTQSIGLPTRDGLFADVTRDETLLKIWNINTFGGVIGVFNARYGTPENGAIITGSAADDIPSETANAQTVKVEANADAQKPDATQANATNATATETAQPHVASAPISGSISASDIAQIEGERFAVWAHHARELRVLDVAQNWELTLPELTAEVFTVMPIEDDFAPLGLVEMFNSGAAIEDWMNEENMAVVLLVSSGKFAAFSSRKPQSVSVHSHDHTHEHDEHCNHEVDFSYDAQTQLLVVELPRQSGATQLMFEF